jgi:hypothetical protein
MLRNLESVKIIRSRAKQRRIVLKVAKTDVAPAAKQATDNPSAVLVIDAKLTRNKALFAIEGRFSLATNRAFSTLAPFHCGKFVFRQSVVPTENSVSFYSFAARGLGPLLELLFSANLASGVPASSAIVRSPIELRKKFSLATFRTALGRLADVPECLAIARIGYSHDSVLLEPG